MPVREPGADLRGRRQALLVGLPPRESVVLPLYNMGPPREVQYFESFPSLYEGWMDDICTQRRGEDDYDKEYA